MAAKRMFNIKLIKSDAFTSMPLSTQALYFHLNLEADDDGFIGNPRGVQRFVGASDDDLNLLIYKGFLIKFDSGVMVVKHWRMHNTLKGDRYVETPYREEGSMLYLKKNGAYTFDETQAVSKLENKWNQNGSKMVPQSSLVQCSVVESSIGKMLLPNKENKKTAASSVVESTATEIPLEPVTASSSRLPPIGIYVEIQNKYNRICTTLQPVERLTKKRKGFLDILFDKGYDLEDFEKLFKKTVESEYFSKLSDDSWKPSFDWLIQEENMTAVLEGKYDKVFSFQGKQEKKNKFNNFKGRNYSSEDMQDLERKLLNQ